MRLEKSFKILYINKLRWVINLPDPSIINYIFRYAIDIIYCDVGNR